MVASKTLLIRHMPSELTPEEKEDFLKHFGALNVKIFGSKSKKTNNVFAVFETHEAADAALKRLHQTELFGQLLAVEFARGEEISADTHAHSYEYEKINPAKKKDKTQKYYENFLYRLSSWASEVDFNIPPPVHLKYQYPPPSSNVLENIAKALATVPKFYTQVLHLMNKMNLPCPFIDPYPIETDLFRKNKYNIFQKENILEESKKAISSPDEESEIESDENESNLNKNIIPSKRNLPEKKRQTKRMKFIKPANKFPTTANKNLLKAEEVFEVSDKEPVARKIEVKITPDLSSIQEAEETQKSVTTVEGFEKLPVSDNISGEEEKQNLSPKDEEAVIVCITEQELAANRIPARDQKILPVFKNYQPGVPSCRLYIKNLAKQVQARDLHYIYRRYMIPDQEEQGMMFDIRLMQEGRMKGQAFINLQNVELAQKALNETNGFILKDKPMVVQFARSSKAK